MTAKAPRCPACSRRVRPHHEEIVVTNLDSGKKWTYHATQACVSQAVSTLMRPGTVHYSDYFAVRIPTESMN